MLIGLDVDLIPFGLGKSSTSAPSIVRRSTRYYDTDMDNGDLIAPHAGMKS